MKKVNALEMRNVEGGATYYSKCGLAFSDRYWKFWFIKIKTYNGKRERDAHQKFCNACRAGFKLY